jgi:hypothetical protein
MAGTGFWESALPGGLGAYGYSQLMGDMDQQRADLKTGIADLQTGADERTQFQPWSIKSGLGSAGTDPNGNMSLSLSPAQQQIQSTLMGGGTNLMDVAQQAAMDPSGREAEIYERIRAMQRPGEERGYNQMNQAAQRQGRTGMGTSEYGGSPEQMAFAQAQAEARNTAGYQSMGEAQNQIGNQFKWGSGMLDQGYTGQRELRKQGALGLEGAGMAQDAQMNNASLWTQLGLGGMTADTNMANVQGNAFGNMMTAMMPVAAGAGAGVDGSNWWDKLNPF